MSGDKNKYEEEREKAEWRKAKKTEVMSEIRSNSAMMSYLSPYKEEDIEKFIEYYADEKIRVIEHASAIAKIKEGQELRWVEDAMERLAEIQQKKLFDLQCLWRAEQVEVEGIEIADDFLFLEKNILNCRLIEPVSEEDIQMYQRYLQSSNFESGQGWFDSWQDYDEIKEAYQTEGENCNFPEWYDFHNGLTGKGVLLSLPNVRGEKEKYYLDIALAEQRKEWEAEEATRPPQPDLPKQLPDLNFHKSGFIDWFVHTFDTEETQGHFCDYGGDRVWSKTEEEQEEDQVQEWIDFLSADGEVFPIRGWYNWREGMERCVEDYHRHKIAEALPEAYEQYCMYQQNGLSFPEDDRAWLEELREITVKRILRGRKLCGEPEDLHF